MFFKSIAPACAKGIVFTVVVESADDQKLAVSVTPTSETGKSGFQLTPRQFVSTPEEFDNEFKDVMAAYAQSQSSLSDQLKAAVVVAEEVAKAASEAATAKKKDSAKAPSSSTRVKSNAAPAGLLDADEDEGDSGDMSSKPTADEIMGSTATSGGTPEFAFSL